MFSGKSPVLNSSSPERDRRRLAGAGLACLLGLGLLVACQRRPDVDAAAADPLLVLADHTAAVLAYLQDGSLSCDEALTRSQAHVARHRPAMMTSLRHLLAAREDDPGLDQRLEALITANLGQTAADVVAGFASRCPAEAEAWTSEMRGLREEARRTPLALGDS